MFHSCAYCHSTFVFNAFTRGRRVCHKIYLLTVSTKRASGPSKVFFAVIFSAHIPGETEKNAYRYEVEFRYEL